jgi:hypothetical protein
VNNPEISPGRAIFIVGLGIAGAFAFVQFWALTAQFPWSSDPWLMAIPTVVIVTGMIAAVALMFVRRK